MKILKIFLILILYPFITNATHIIGGEFNYSYIGNNQYELDIIVYRDCFNGIPPFDNPLALGVFDSLDTLISVFHLNITSVTSIDTGCSLLHPTNICIEFANYHSVVTLPGIPGGYQLAYQRCCRPSYVNNVDSIQSTGTTIFATIPDSIYAVNSNPKFKYNPFTYLCQNSPFSFDNSAIDADGDSIGYTLYTPLSGANLNFPIPDPPSNPPYDEIVWATPFTLSSIMPGSFNIDQQTGILSGTPTSVGTYVYGVCAKEFRNGIYLGETKRDFQINVVNFVGVNDFSENDFFRIEKSGNGDYLFIINNDLELKNASLNIYNLTGRKILEMNAISNEIKIDGNNYPTGIYYYELKTSVKVFTGKLIY